MTPVVAVLLITALIALSVMWISLADEETKPVPSRCVVCNGTDNLAHIFQYAASGTYDWVTEYYYHVSCIQRVLDAPEQFSELIDIAIYISDRMIETREKGKRLKSALEET